MSYDNNVTDRCLDTSSTELKASSNGKAATLLLHSVLASAFVFLPLPPARVLIIFGASRHDGMHGVAMLGVEEGKFRASSSSSSCFMRSLNQHTRLTDWTENGFSRHTCGYFHLCSTC